MLKRIMGIVLIIGIMVTGLVTVSADGNPALTLETTIASQNSSGASALDMCISEKYAFVNYGDWIEVYDIQTTPKAPVYLTNIQVPTGRTDNCAYMDLYQIEVYGNYLFVECHSKDLNYISEHYIAIFDVSTIAKDQVLTVVARTQDVGNGNEKDQLVFCVNNDVLVVAQYRKPGGFYFFDVSSATINSAMESGTKLQYNKHVDTTTAGCASGELVGYVYGTCCLDGNYFYYTIGSKTRLAVCVADVSGDGFNIIGTYNISEYSTAVSTATSAKAIDVVGNHLYVATCRTAGAVLSYEENGETKTKNEKNGLYIFDVSATKSTGTAATPVAPALLSTTLPGGTINDNSRIEGMAINGDYAYLWGSGNTSSMKRMFMYDISDKTAPVLMDDTREDGLTTSPGAFHSIALKGSQVYSCAKTNGLLVHSVTGNEVTTPEILKGTVSLDYLENDNLKGQITVKNYSAEPYEGVLIIAYYEGNKLGDVKTKNVSVPAGSKAAVVTTDELAVSNGTRVKAMLWNGWTTLQPISMKEIVPVQ
ncbi:MAG: hypothetical protein II997_05625 [Clostridia bacterium]|nr:hypothetical protein [Clostridia bacterium]